MTQRLDNKRDLAFRTSKHFWTSVFEHNASPPNGHFVVRTVSQVDDFRRYLRRKPQQVCCPCSVRHNLPALPPRNRARRFVDVGAKRSTKSGIDARHVIETPVDTTHRAFAG